MTGKQLFFKSEMFQKTGSFKVWKIHITDSHPHHHHYEQARGALNAIKSCLERGEKVARVVTHSSGNHGQVIAMMVEIIMIIAIMIMVIILIF